jgi:hypothetical protein
VKCLLAHLDISLPGKEPGTARAPGAASLNPA